MGPGTSGSKVRRHRPAERSASESVQATARPRTTGTAGLAFARSTRERCGHVFCRARRLVCAAGGFCPSDADRRDAGAAGWAVQDAKAVNLAAARGVAVREFVMKPPHGRADYLLFLDGRAGGRRGGEEGGRDAHRRRAPERQVRRRAAGRARAGGRGRPAVRVRVDRRETRFTNRLDPDATSRPVFRSTGPRRWRWLDEYRAAPPPDAATPPARAAGARYDGPLAGAGP